MVYYVIVNGELEDTWYDFLKEVDTYEFETTCLIPTKELAEQIIKDKLSSKYKILKVRVDELKGVKVKIWSII